MKLLLVGDVHAKVEDLGDCDELLFYVDRIANQEQVDAVVFLGDQNHHHSIVHVAVQKFWLEVFSELNRKNRQIIALVGNHDQAGNGDPECHSMLPYSSLVSLVDVPKIQENVLLVPYMGDADEFVRVCNQNPADILICHQTFSGSKYENGFYAKDGINPDLLAQKLIVSGHIHSPQEFGKVWYPGSPRWQTISDANVDRAIWTLDTQTLERRAFSTNDVCRRILHLTDTPEAPATIPTGNVRVLVDIKGPALYIEDRKKQLAGPDIRIRTFSTDGQVASVRESDGIGVAFKKFVDSYQPKYMTDRDEIYRLAQEFLNA